MKEFLKNELKSELKLFLKDEYTTFVKDGTIDDMLELYEEFAYMKTSYEEGIRQNWMENVEGFYRFGETRVTNHNALINSEGFFKKVLFTVDSKAIESKDQLCMFETMEKLGLLDALPPKAKEKIDRYDYNLLTTPTKCATVITYQLRNNISHEADAWANSQMLLNINAIMVVTIMAVWRNREVIRNQVNKITGEGQFGITTLLQRIVKDYEAEKRKGFVYFPLSWEGSGVNDESKYKRIEFAELSADKHILLSAEAGCGKTTSLQNLEYQLAKSYLSGSSNKIPVNVALIDQSADASIKNIICEKLSISLAYCEELLKNGTIYLMVDGLNELTSDMDLRRKFIFTLERFFRDYPNVFVVVTDREYSLLNINVDKTYHLKKMEKEDVINYAKTKAECDAKTLTLLEELLDKSAFKTFDYTPLMVNRIIISLSLGEHIPNDYSELIGEYLEALMNRELKEKREYNAAPKKLEIFLMKLAAEDYEKGIINYYTALEICGEAIEKYHIDLSSNKGIELAIQMGILKQNGDYIEFAFEEYRDYYFMKAYNNNIYK